jgi:nucleotide-binding universal stress UspA family protein
VATTVSAVCRIFTPDHGFTELLKLRNGQVAPGCRGSGTAVLKGRVGRRRAARICAEAEHGEADAVVVAALGHLADRHSRLRDFCAVIRADFGPTLQR